MKPGARGGGFHHCSTAYGGLRRKASGPTGDPVKPLASYQIEPTNIWIEPSLHS